MTLSIHPQTHSGSVWRVVWAHPEFGQVLATCSFDRTVAVWEEQGIYLHVWVELIVVLQFYCMLPLPFISCGAEGYCK